MVTCGRQPFNMLPMAPINPFVVGLTPSVAAAAAAAAAVAETATPNHTITTTTTTATTSLTGTGIISRASAAGTICISNAATTMRPKLAFSIDSIVGSGAAAQSERRTCRTSIVSSPLSFSQRSESPEERNGDRERFVVYDRSPSRLSLGPSEDSHSYCQQPLELRNSLPVNYRSVGGPTMDLTTNQPLAHRPPGLIYCRRRSTLDQSPERDCSSPSNRRTSRSRSPAQLQQPQQSTRSSCRSRSRTPTPTPTTPNRATPQTPPSNVCNKGPILVPGIPAGLIRPLPLPVPPNLVLLPPGHSPSEGGTAAPPTSTAAPTLHQLPPAIPVGAPPSLAPAGGVPPPPAGAGGPPPPPPNPHFLAAQFQMAAALAHHHHQQQQQQHHPPPPHLPPGHPMAIFPHGPHHPHFGGPHLIRDSYPLYPWLLSRHGRIFPHRFPGNFLLQPFRKPKRVRTAFSPTQLLKLEHAFEGNHYVVGAERKQLAQGLSLTETQVKVWFQNRRTKHKRMQQEGDSDSKSNKGSQGGGDNDAGKNDSSQNSFEDQEEEDDEELIEDEDEVIDMDDYGSEMDAEEQQRMREQFQQQLQQHHEQIQQHMQQQQQQQQHQHQQLSREQQAAVQQQQQQHQQQFMQHQLYLHHQQQQQQHQQQQQQQQQQQKQLQLQQP